MQHINFTAPFQRINFDILPIMRGELTDQALRDMTVGDVLRAEMQVIEGVTDLRRKLRALSDTLGADFLVFGVMDNFFYWEKTAAIVKAQHGTYYKPTIDATRALLASMAEGEQVRATYDNEDVRAHVMWCIDDYQQGTKARFELLHIGDGRTMIVERISIGNRRKSALSGSLDELAAEKMRHRPGIEKPYHCLEVGGTCSIEFDGSKPKELNLRTTVCNYGRRADMKFTVNKSGDKLLQVTRIA